MTIGRVTLQAATNGDSTHPATPRTPAEIAEDAAACVAAGATMFHLHAFDDDGNESLAAGPVSRVLQAVRARCPGVPINMTTFAAIEPDPEVRYRLVESWTDLPDLTAANQGEAGIGELSELLLERGVKVEACLLSAADADLFVSTGNHALFQRVVIEALEDSADDAVAHAAEMEDMVTRAGIQLEQVHHGIGMATWAVCARAAARGHGIRTGLEDTLHLPDGTPTSGNPELVLAAAALLST